MAFWYGLHLAEAVVMYATPESAASAVLRDRAKTRRGSMNTKMTRISKRGSMSETGSSAFSSVGARSTMESEMEKGDKAEI